ncbi:MULTISPECIES: type III secretion system inner membrane ring lipoprotein SctJ [Pseudomonas]|uniref:type III secretion system inner membrane ring lipoprotein SctJ n=1 Tax=Pseudomonas TaxID=286 RepID=UPI0015A0B24F|nr:type III secretion inner membrane ring lipoprotein SctJ [Pseudomonas sp. Ost2]NWE49194.1 type III secretion inner membrane ring lipoprotein SctJ [Pseudomonas gingeri]BBP74620.1 EscJ/YscJ/HrcJ family type III secretion inner membrane ring protein [Pseudomonas sp. Ost2]
MRSLWPLLLLCLSLLAGCSDESKLFGGLSEQDANEVIAQLADQHIEAHKQAEKVGVTVIVSSHDINRAVRVLDAAGLPRRTRTSLGEIFKKEGVISTPLEERARYIYALSQELESTLSQIDGVVVARVHVVLPERIAPGEPVQPASAAVFIKHTSALDPDSVRGRIQQMVASSIPGMSQETLNSKKFAIVFVPAVEFEDKQKLVAFGPFLVDSRDQGFWNSALLVAVAGVLLLLLLIVLILRADWRQALLGRLLPGRRNASRYPARL